MREKKIFSDDFAIFFFSFSGATTRFDQREREKMCEKSRFSFPILLFTDFAMFDSFVFLLLRPISCRCRGNYKTEWKIAVKRYLSNDATHSKCTHTHTHIHTLARPHRYHITFERNLRMIFSCKFASLPACLPAGWGAKIENFHLKSTNLWYRVCTSTSIFKWIETDDRTHGRTRRIKIIIWKEQTNVVVCGSPHEQKRNKKKLSLWKRHQHVDLYRIVSHRIACNETHIHHSHNYTCSESSPKNGHVWSTTWTTTSLMNLNDKYIYVYVANVLLRFVYSEQRLLIWLYSGKWRHRTHTLG